MKRLCLGLDAVLDHQTKDYHHSRRFIDRRRLYVRIRFLHICTTSSYQQYFIVKCSFSWLAQNLKQQIKDPEYPITFSITNLIYDEDFVMSADLFI